MWWTSKARPSYRDAFSAEGIPEGDLGIAFTTPSEMRALKSQHLGIDEETDVLRSRSTDAKTCPTAFRASWAT